ncbi:MAG: cytochrome C oxidase subunit IV family protein [Rhodothermales bacterium]
MKAQHGHHVTPKKTLIKVFAVLVVLTIVTALTAQLDLGGLDVPLALAIASTKAGLVVLFFMALKYDNKVNALVFALGVTFVAIFLTFTLFDTAFRGDLGNVGSETISDIERRESMLRDRAAGVPESTEGTASDPSIEGGEE